MVSRLDLRPERSKTAQILALRRIVERPNKGTYQQSRCYLMGKLQRICDLDFAAEIVLLSKETEQARQLLQGVQQECSNVGLELNVNKREAQVPEPFN